MRRLAVLVGLLTLAMASSPSAALGGVLVAGVGFGETYIPPGGPAICSGPGHLLDVEAVYLPGGKGVLNAGYYPSTACPTSNGGVWFVGHTPVTIGVPPSVEVRFDSCSGTEATGMSCRGEAMSGGLIWAQVGPYRGPGGSVNVEFCDPERCIRGSFTAT